MICALFISAYSLHFSGEYNNVTPGVGVSCEKSSVVYSAMALRNSIRNNSLAVSVGYRFKLSDRFSLSPFVGAATGYHRPIVPLVGVSFNYDNLQFIFLPPSPKSAATVNFSVVF